MMWWHIASSHRSYSRDFFVYLFIWHQSFFNELNKFHPRMFYQISLGIENDGGKEPLELLSRQKNLPKSICNPWFQSVSQFNINHFSKTLKNIPVFTAKHVCSWLLNRIDWWFVFFRCSTFCCGKKKKLLIFACCSLALKISPTFHFTPMLTHSGSCWCVRKERKKNDHEAH